MKALLLVAFLGTLTYPTETSILEPPPSCPRMTPQAPCNEFWRYDTVFIGTVRKLVKVPFEGDLRPDYQHYKKITATLTVDETFRGKLEPEVVFEMEDCYFGFIQDEKYLVYTNRGEGGTSLRLHQGRSPTKLLSEASADLDFIRSLSNASPGGRIFGDLWDHSDSPKFRSTTQGASYSKLAGITLFLRSGQKTYQTVTDAAGHYEFAHLPPGSYEISADLPNFLTGTRHTLAVVDKGCVNLDFSVQATGAIKGRLIGTDGKPVSNAYVGLFSADGTTRDLVDNIGRDDATVTATAKDGTFSFARLRSGRYHVAVNLFDEDRTNDAALLSDYPRIFHPGVTSFKDAKAITLTDGGKVENIEIKLPVLTTKQPPSP